MSEVIDSRIVEMRFDNSQFESNVRESMRTIDNLKSSLNFEGSVKGLDKLKVDIDASGAIHGLNAISDAASDCDLSALNNSAESVKLSFSALEVVAVTALGKITSAAIDAGAKAVKAFAVQPITDGFSEYNQQLQSTRVIVSNTGQSLKEVTRILDDLNVYADKTIYSFGDMTQAMGYFTSALGENSAEAAATIAKGISNWAASTGQGNQVAKRVMYQVSQGLSTGTFRLMDWKSIENTGAMAGQRYQEAFIKTAQDIYGYTIDEIMVDKSGNPVTSFRESLQSGWLDNTVFLETMRRFANETDILNEKGERAFQWMEDAATKVLTFSDLMDTVREQLGTGWGDTWKIVFGNYEQSISFFTGISNRIGNFITEMNNARNAIFQGWSDKGGRKLLFGISEEDTGAVGKILDGIINLLTQVHDAFINAFGTKFLANMLYGVTEVISKIANGFERFTSIPIIYSALGSIFSILKSIISVLGNLYKIAEPFIEFALSVIEKILQGVGKVAEVIANVVSKISEAFNGITTDLLKPFQDASNFITDVFGKALDFVVEKISSVWNWLKQFDIFGLMGENTIDGLIAVNDGLENAKNKSSDVNSNLQEVNETLEKTAETGHKVSLSLSLGDANNTNNDTINNLNTQINKTADNAVDRIDHVKKRLADLGIIVEGDARVISSGWQDVLWTAMDESKRQQHFASELWNDLNDEQRKAWLDVAAYNDFYEPGKLDELNDIWKELWGLGQYSAESTAETAKNIDGVDTSLENIEKKSREVTGTWWDLISEADKKRYFAEQYWDELTEEQREGWKQYALGLGLFTKEELDQLEGTEKSIDNLLDDRDRLANKKRAEADAWWNLISEDNKKQYFAGQFWDDLTDEQREAWRKRAEEYNLYDPEEYARLLAEMNAAEQAAFSPENTQEIEESASGLENWFKKASQIPVIGGFLEKIGWALTKTVKNTKSFVSAVGTSFGGFFDYVKILNSTDYSFSEKFGLAARYFKENVSDYLGQLVVKNFKTVGDILANNTIVSKLTSFTSAVKDRFGLFKDYVSEINQNANLTFPEKFKLSLDYFKSNVVDYLGQLVGKNLKSIGEELTNNKIVSNITSLVSAGKTKFGEFKAYITDLNANTELTFPEKLERSLSFLKTNVIDYFLELVNKNLKSVGIDVEQIGKDISQALSDAVRCVEITLNEFGINTEALKKFFWNDDGTLKSIPAVITDLGNKIENAINSVKTKLRSIYEGFFPSTEDGMLTGPLGWLANLKSKVDDFIASIFGSKEELEKAKKRGMKGGLLQSALGTLGITDSSSLIQAAGGVISALSFGKSVGISGKFDFGKIAIGVALAAGAFTLLSKVDFSKLGIDFKGFTDYFKDGEGNLLSASEIFNKVGQSISNSKLVTWIGNTAKLIGQGFSDSFNLLKEKSLYFREFLKVLNESDLSFPQKFNFALRFFKEQFIIPFGELTKNNLKNIGIDFDAFANYFKDNEGNWLSIGKIIEKVGTDIKNAFNDLKTKFEQTKFAQWFNEKFEWIKTKFSGVFEWFSGLSNNISRYIIPVLAGAGIAFVISRVGQLFDFIVSIGQIFSGRTPEARAEAFATRAQALVEIIKVIAVSVMMIAGTIAGLSLLNQDELARASESLNRIITAITWLIGILSAGAWINSRGREESKKTATTILEISASIFLIATAFKIITTIPLERDKIWQLVGSFVILGLLMTMVAAFAKFSPKLEGSKSSFLGMVGIATAVLEMVGALYLVQLMLESHRGIGWALITLFGIVGMLALLGNAAKSVSWKAGVGLILMANSVRTMIGALERVMDSDLVTKFRENWLQNLIKIFAVFFSLWALAKINSQSGGGKAGMNLLGVAASVWVLVRAMEAIAEIPTEDVWRALAVVSILSVVMGLIMVAYSALNNGNKTSLGSMIANTVQLYAVVIGVLLLCAAVAVLSTIEQSKLITAGAVVGVLTTVVGLIAILLGKVSAFASFKTALGLIATVTVVAALMGGLIWALATYIPPESDLIKISGSVAILTGIIGLFSILLAKTRVSKFYDFGKMVGALGSMVVVLGLVSLIFGVLVNNFPKDMDTGLLWSITGSIAALTGIVALLAGLFGTIVKVDLTSAAKAAGAMFIFGVVIEALVLFAGFIYAWQGDNIEKVFSIIERIGNGLTKMFSSVVTTLGKLNWWQFAAVFAAVAVAVVAAAAAGLQIAINLAAIVGIVGLVSEVIITIAALIYGWQGENIEKLVTLMGRVGRGFAKIFDSLMTSIGKLNWYQLVGVIAVFGVAVAALSTAGPIIGFNLGIFAAEMAIGAAVVVGILDLTLPWFEKFTNDGIPIFEKIASGIVRIASIIMDGIVANVETIIQCLRDFSNFAVNDFDAAKVGEAVAIAGQLTEIIGAFVGDSFLDMLGKFIGEKLFGETNRAVFTTNMKTIGEALRTFCTEVNSIPSLDLGKAYLAAPIAEKMIELVKKFAPENVGEAFWQWFSSLSFNSDVFKNNITNLSSAVSTFCGEVENWKVPTDYKSKFEVVDALIEFVDKMPSLDNGLIGIDQFGEMVKAFGESFLSATYYLNSALSKSDITNYDEKLTVIDDLIEISEKLPPAASAMGQFFGYNVTQSLGQFSDDISVFGNNLKAFAESMNKVDPIMDWDTKKTIIGQLIEFAKLLPKDSSEWEKEVGYGFQMDFAAFGEDIEAFAKSFNIVVDEINKLSITEKTLNKYHQMQGLVEELAALSKQLPQAFSQTDTTGNFSTVTSTYTQSFSEFIESILGNADLLSLNGPNFSNSLFDRVNQIYEEIDKLGEFTQERKNALDSLTSEDGILRKLSNVAKNLPDFSNDDTKLGDFGLQIQGLAVNLTQAANTLSGDGTEDSFKFDPKPLEDLGTGINGIITAFDDVETEKLGQISSIIESVSEILSGDKQGGGFGQLIGNLVNSFLGDPFKGINEAKTNAESVGGILSNISGLGDLLNNITGEGGLDLTRLTQIFGTAGTDGTASGGVMSLIPSVMTSFVTDMPKTTEVASAKESLTSMFTGLNFDFSSLGPLMGNFSQGIGFDDTGIIQMMPTEIQDFITNMIGEGGSGLDLTSVNQMLTDLTSGITEAGSITPDMAENFNTTLATFANNGISAYTDVFNSEEVATKLQIAGSTIISKTSDGINKALAAIPNSVQTASKAVVTFITDILSGDNTNPYDTPGKTIINKTGSAISSALSSSPTILRNAVKSVVRFITNILSGNDGDDPYKSTGTPIIMRTANGIKAALNSSSYLLRDAAKAMVNVITYVLSGYSEEMNPYTSAGYNVITGFIAGMADTSSVYEAAQEIGLAAVSGLSEAIDSNSPSQEAVKYGRYFGEGFELGISSYSDIVKTASENVGNDAVLGFASYVGKVYDLLDSDLEVNPKITPILDLSEIQNGVGMVDALFSRRQAYSTNMEVKEALQARSEAMRAVNSTTDNSRNFGGFTFNIYTHGTDAKSIAKEVGDEVNRRLRVTGSLI